MGCGLLGRGASTTSSLSRTPCLISIRLITKGCSLRHPCHSLVQQILAFRDVYTSMQWNHTIREANRVADTLAKHGLSLEDQYRVFNLALAFLDMSLLVDRNNVNFSRDL